MKNKKIYIKRKKTKTYIYFSKITFQNTHGCIFNMKKWMKNIVPFLIKEEIYIEFKINGFGKLSTKGRDNKNLHIFIANTMIIHSNFIHM
jgi:hypothetical protein